MIRTLEQGEGVAYPSSGLEAPPRFEQWSNSRARLNHDWLQNQYLIFLAARQPDLRAMVSGEESRLGVRTQLLEWEHREKAFLDLADQAEEALSPRQLVDLPPLDELFPPDRAWLGDLVHELFCIQTQIRQRATAIYNCVMDISRLVRLLAGLDGVLEKEEPAPRKAWPAELLAQCRRLSTLISGLPHRVEL